MAEQATEHDLEPQRISELGDAQLVDVRTPAEYETSRLEGALHIPLDELQAAADNLDRARPVVFYCRSGERSQMAVEAFRASGWDAYAMSGGLLAWAEAGLPLEPEGAEVAQHSSIPSP
jgi:rhodanese-related sulfurtransferase